MRALEREVVDAVYAAIEPLLPEPPVHPLGCHRPRVPDRLVFWGILIRLTTGASWVDIEAILEHRVSDTTLRARRDEWIAAGVFPPTPRRSASPLLQSVTTYPRNSLAAHESVKWQIEVPASHRLSPQALPGRRAIVGLEVPVARVRHEHRRHAPGGSLARLGATQPWAGHRVQLRAI
jgi:transposase